MFVASPLLDYSVEVRVAPQDWPSEAGSSVDVRFFTSEVRGAMVSQANGTTWFMSTTRSSALLDSWRNPAAIAIPTSLEILSDGEIMVEGARQGLFGKHPPSSMTIGGRHWTLESIEAADRRLVRGSNELDESFSIEFAKSPFFFMNGSYSDADGILWKLTYLGSHGTAPEDLILKMATSRMILSDAGQLMGGAAPRQVSDETAFDNSWDLYAAYSFQCDAENDAMRQVPLGAKISFQANGRDEFVLECNRGKIQENGYVLICPQGPVSNSSIKSEPSLLSTLSARFAAKLIVAQDARFQIQANGEVVALTTASTPTCSF